MSKRRILIVDDHPVVRAGIRATIAQRADWEVCGEAGDGESACRLASETSPHVAIVDYSLPLLNGLETTRRICRSNNGTQVLIYTMHDDEALVREALRAGARGYLFKSNPDRDLLQAVDALLLGRTFFSQRVSEYLLTDFLCRSEQDAPAALTEREREVVQLVAGGDTNKQIAARWGVSVKTVDTHRTSAMRKLNLRTAVDLARYAIRNRMIEP